MHQRTVALFALCLLLHVIAAQHSATPVSYFWGKSLETSAAGFVYVPMNEPIEQVLATETSSYALAKSGNLFCWGICSNFLAPQKLPLQIFSSFAIRQFVASAAQQFGYFLTRNFVLYAWQQNHTFVVPTQRAIHYMASNSQATRVYMVDAQNVVWAMMARTDYCAGFESSFRDDTAMNPKNLTMLVLDAKVKQIAVGRTFALILTSDGFVHEIGEAVPTARFGRCTKQVTLLDPKYFAGQQIVQVAATEATAYAITVRGNGMVLMRYIIISIHMGNYNFSTW